MRIGTNDFYNDYCYTLKESLEINNNELKTLNKSRDYLIDCIYLYEEYIINFTNIDLEKIKEVFRHIPEKSIIVLTNQIGLDLKRLVFSINGVIGLNKEIKKIEERIIELNKLFINKEIFKTILNRFNIKISDKIIDKGYSYHLGFGISKISIKKIRCDNRQKKLINWNESNKKKREILDRGGIPYAVTERDELKRKIADNGGEDWFIYFNTMFDYLWYWNKKRCTITNAAYYKFKPTCYNNTTKGGNLGNVNRLKRLVTNNDESLKMYGL